MSSDSDSETPMLYIMQSDNLSPPSVSAESDNDEGGDTRNAKDPQDVDVKVLPPEESPSPVPSESRRCLPLPRHLCNHDIGGSLMNEDTYFLQNAPVWHVKFPRKLAAAIKKQIYRLWSCFVLFVA